MKCFYIIHCLNKQKKILKYILSIITLIARDTEYSKTLNKKIGLNIEYISTPENKGFAGGNNTGAKKAIADGCEYIFFLNNDTILGNNCLSELINPLLSDPQTAVSSPIIFYWNGGKTKDRVQEFGADADFKSYRITKFFEGVNYSDFESKIPGCKIVKLVSGAATMIKAEALAKTGLWEESYFAYGDEIDLAKRIKRSRL